MDLSTNNAVPLKTDFDHVHPFLYTISGSAMISGGCSKMPRGRPKLEGDTDVEGDDWRAHNRNKEDERE